MKIKLASSEIENIDRRKSNNSVAYEQYLFARNKIWQGSKESVQEAIESLESNLKVIGKNENLLVALGLAYFQYINSGFDTDLSNLSKAEDYIDEAIEMNALSSKAFYVKGMIYETKGDVKKAFKAIKRSLELNNNDSEALMIYSFLCCLVGQPEKGKESAYKAIEIDPLNPWIYSGKQWIYLCEGRFSEYEKVTFLMHNLDENNRLLFWGYGHSLALNGNYNEAVKIMEQLQNNNSDDIAAKISGTFQSALTNETGKLKSFISYLKTAADNDHLFAWYLAQACSLANEKEMALDFMERAIRDIFINYPLFNEVDPFLKNIRGEKRFKKLMERVKNKWENFEV